MGKLKKKSVEELLKLEEELEKELKERGIIALQEQVKNQNKYIKELEDENEKLKKENKEYFRFIKKIRELLVNLYNDLDIITDDMTYKKVREIFKKEGENESQRSKS